MIKLIRELIKEAVATASSIGSFELQREQAYSEYLAAGAEPYDRTGCDCGGSGCRRWFRHRRRCIHAWRHVILMHKTPFLDLVERARRETSAFGLYLAVLKSRFRGQVIMRRVGNFAVYYHYRPDQWNAAGQIQTRLAAGTATDIAAILSFNGHTV